MRILVKVETTPEKEQGEEEKKQTESVPLSVWIWDYSLVLASLEGSLSHLLI